MSLWKRLAARYGSGAGEVDDVRMDSTTNALIGVDYAHHEVHDGSHYFIKKWADITGAATVAYFMFVTPNTTKRIHAKVAIAAEAEFRVEIFEGGTVSANGTALTAINNDRDSASTAGLLAYNAPTVTSDGTQIWDTVVGSGKNSTISLGLNYEIIAATDETYLFKITKVAAGTHWIDFDFFWYEHTSKH